MMKIQIRKNCFETNSSSTHALCIKKQDPNIVLPKTFTFHFKPEHYWLLETEMNTAQDRADWLYMVILWMPFSYYMVHVLQDIFKAHNIIPITEEPKDISDDCWLDIDNEIEIFVKNLLNDPEKLIRFIFSKDTVSIYTDRDYEQEMDKIFTLEDSSEYEVFRRNDL